MASPLLRKAASHRLAGSTAQRAPLLLLRRPHGASSVMKAERTVVASSTSNDGAPSTTTTTTEASSSSSSSNGKADEPIWVRREKERQLQSEAPQDLPWGLYLLASTLVAIAAVGCIFEYVDRNPFFGVIPPDSPAWAPILITLAVTGIPVSGFLFFKGVNGFNEAAERQDRLDGYLDD